MVATGAVSICACADGAPIRSASAAVALAARSRFIWLSPSALSSEEPLRNANDVARPDLRLLVGWGGLFFGCAVAADVNVGLAGAIGVSACDRHGRDRV